MGRGAKSALRDACWEKRASTVLGLPNKGVARWGCLIRVLRVGAA